MSTLRTPHHSWHGQPLCPICNEPVKLEKAKTDGDGHAVHDECYLNAIQGKIPPPQKRKTDN